MNISSEHIQNSVYELGKKIGASKSDTQVYFESPQNGQPHVVISESEFKLVYEERGHIFKTKKTKELDTLLYWLLCAITSKLAQNYGLKNRCVGKDSRRVIFFKQIELMYEISDLWAMRLKEEINDTLKRNPYVDRA